jgi:hypothetical protein
LHGICCVEVSVEFVFAHYEGINVKILANQENWTVVCL